MDAWAKEQMAAWRIPGMVVGVYRNGEPEHVAAYGYADIEHCVPMKRESVCEICSITKQFTATAVLLLKEDGKLSLCDAVGCHVPQMPATWRDMTLSELLHHTSGINDDNYDLGSGALTEEVLAKAATSVTRPRGTAWEYSNLAYRLLGEVVANVSEQPFFEFLHKRVLGPAGLQNTQPNSSAIIPNRVHGYVLVAETLFNAPMLTDLAGGGAGGLVSTVDDLNRWSTALMNGELLSPESRSAMLEPGLLTSGDVARPPYSAGGYGLGVNVNSVGGHRIEKHAGGWDDASAQLTRLLDDNVTVAILTNFGGWLLRPWAGEIVASMFVPVFRLPKLEPMPDPNPTRLITLGAVFEELAAGELSSAHVSARLHALLSSDFAGWRDATKANDLAQTYFAERVPQGARELMIYRHEGEQPGIVVAGFESDGKLDSIAIAPLPE